jgi:hypothetical protein
MTTLRHRRQVGCVAARRFGHRFDGALGVVPYLHDSIMSPGDALPSETDGGPLFH